MHQNSALLVAMAKGNGGGGGGGGGGSVHGGGGGGGGNKRRDHGTKANFPNCNMVIYTASDCYTLPKHGQNSYLVQAPQLGLTGTGVPQ
jgi:hypothetical protein